MSFVAKQGLEPSNTSTTALLYCFYFQVKEAVKYALSVGYRHIDCATAYSNEAEIGDALQESVGADKVRKGNWGCVCVLHLKSDCKYALEGGWRRVACYYFKLLLLTKELL